MANRIVFFGSSLYSLTVLEILKTHPKVKIHAVITNPDRPAGRGQELTPNPVKVLAEKSRLPVFTSISDYFAANLPLPSGDVIYGLVAAFGQIISQADIHRFENRIFNIHPSLLPKYRGASPLQTQILDGIGQTGITIIQIDEKVDHGPIIIQETFNINPNTPILDLGQGLFGLGAHLFINFLLHPENFPPHPQDDTQATYTPKITKENGFVPWDTFKSEANDPDSPTQRKFRAYYPWPGVWTTMPDGRRLKLTNLNPLMVQPESAPKPIPFSQLV